MTVTRRIHPGFSLTELLVSMVVGLILLGGLVTLMVNSKKNYAVQDYSARLQENARFAMEFLAYDIRMAGYFGCSNTDVRDPDNIVDDNNDPVPRLVSGTNSYGDSVIITYAHPDEQVQLLSYDPASSNQWTVQRIPDSWGEDGDDVDLVISSCAGASLVNATIDDDENGEGHSELTLWEGGSDMKTALGRIYDPANPSTGPTMVSRLVSREYCIEIGESGVPALHRETPPAACGADSPELVEGVENLQLLYREAGGFQTAIGTPVNVTAAQLGLLVRSISNEDLDGNPDRQFGSGADITLDDGQDIPLLDQTVNAGEIRGQRKVFSNTLIVRNRSL